MCPDLAVMILFCLNTNNVDSIASFLNLSRLLVDTILCCCVYVVELCVCNQVCVVFVTPDSLLPFRCVSRDADSSD